MPARKIEPRQLFNAIEQLTDKKLGFLTKTSDTSVANNTNATAGSEP